MPQTSCRLHLVFSSPRHLMVAGGCIIVMELSYKMDFSLAGFLICSLILGVGMLIILIIILHILIMLYIFCFDVTTTICKLPLMHGNLTYFSCLLVEGRHYSLHLISYFRDHVDLILVGKCIHIWFLPQRYIR